MKNDIKKIYKILALIFCVVVCLSCNVYAVWDEDYYTHLYRHVDKEGVDLNDNIITYDEIDDLIFHRNPTMQNKWLVFDVKKDINDTSDIYYDQADALEVSGNDEATDAMNAAKAQGLRISGDNAVDDSYTNYLNNVKTEKTIALETKIAFINYHKSLLDLEKAKKSLESALLSLESARINYEVGNITKSEFYKVDSSYREAIANIDLLNNAVVSNKRTVLINCGYYMDENVELANIVHVTPAMIDARNDFYDKKEAIDNNFQYMIFKKQLENSHSEEMKTTKKINVDNAEKYIISDMDAKYNNMHDGLSSIYTATLSYQSAINDMNYMKNSYDKGTVSKKEYEQSRLNHDIKLIDLQLKNYDIDILYETYMASKDGLASASAQG